MIECDMTILNWQKSVALKIRNMIKNEIEIFENQFFFLVPLDRRDYYDSELTKIFTPWQEEHGEKWC